jgi:hypothetical protein
MECRVETPDGGIVALDGDDPRADEWYGAGPGGEHLGPLAVVLARCSPGGTDPMWIRATVDALHRHPHVPPYLLVKQRNGETMFHASRSANRESIRRHGLDWRRMVEPGVAGNAEPEWAGIHLCDTLESARWFAMMAGPRRADIWRVDVDGLWLEGDPSASGGMDDGWMISAVPIPAAAIKLLERDVSAS